MKKIALHWQILIALLLSITYGLIFSSNYILTENHINEIVVEQSLSNTDTKELKDAIKPLLNVSYNSLSAFNLELKNKIRPEIFSKYESSLTKKAYYNPWIKAVNWMGILFLRALKMIVIPLIVLSILSGITSINDGSSLGRLGIKTLIYYISTSLLAIITGLFLANIFKPGVGISETSIASTDLSIENKNISDILIEIIPTNIFNSLAQNQLISIIFFTILIGIFINKVQSEKRDFLATFIDSSLEVIMKLTMFIIKLAPIGIFGLVCKVIADQDNVAEIFISLGRFTLVVVAALVIHSVIIIPLILRIIGKASPLQHFKNMITPLLTAFSTASSAAALPLTMKHVEEKSGVSSRIINFTIPVGTTVNMDGTAIYITIVVMFIAQIYGVDLNTKQQLLLVTTALLTSIGTAAIPMASLVIMTIVLSVLGLPFEAIAIVLPVDRILDMLRTSTNVWSDSCGAVLIAKTEGEQTNV